MYVMLHATDTCRSYCINALWFVVISQERERERERGRESAGILCLFFVHVGAVPLPQRTGEF